MIKQLNTLSIIITPLISPCYTVRACNPIQSSHTRCLVLCTRRCRREICTVNIGISSHALQSNCNRSRMTSTLSKRIAHLSNGGTGPDAAAARTLLPVAPGRSLRRKPAWAEPAVVAAPCCRSLAVTAVGNTGSAVSALGRPNLQGRSSVGLASAGGSTATAVADTLGASGSVWSTPFRRYLTGYQAR